MKAKIPKGDIYGHIYHVPKAMLASLHPEKCDKISQNLTKSQKMVGECKARTFERLLGYVDFEAKSTDGCESICEKL